MAISLVEQRFENGKTLLKFEKNDVFVYRCVTGQLTNQQINAIKDEIRDNFSVNKPDRKVSTRFGEIRKSKKEEFLDFAKAKMDEIEVKRRELNNV